jgi:uncharacterized membrane protein YeaQ/YmgE (transglycosylase-associated protein family)
VDNERAVDADPSYRRGLVLPREAVGAERDYRGGMLLALLIVLIVLLVVLPLIGLAVWALVSVGIVGILIGGLARLVLPGRQNIGLLATVLLGWIGSLIGGFVGYKLLHTGKLPTVLLEIAAAALLIWIYRESHNRSLTPGSRRRAIRW